MARQESSAQPANQTGQPATSQHVLGRVFDHRPQLHSPFISSVTIIRLPGSKQAP